MTWARTGRIGVATTLVALLAAAGPGAETGAPPTAYEVRREYATEESENGRGSGTSSGNTIIVARVVGDTPEGTEIVYDLPADTPADARAREWELPVHVRRDPGGTYILLDEGDRLKRRDVWLARAKLDPKLCGTWYFTWNAFKIECDPRAILARLPDMDPFATPPALGTPFRTPHTAAAPWQAGTVAGELVARAAIDPQAVRRERAESDVIVGKLMQQPVTLEAALATRAAETITGTSIATASPDRSLITIVTDIVTTDAQGATSRRKATVRYTRRPLSR